MTEEQMHILIVDDDRLIVHMLSDLLRERYAVHTASDGQEALEALRKQSVAAVLCDHMMPKLTGVQVLAQCMEIQPDAIRILITASEDIKDLHDAVNTARVHRFLVKPIRTLELPKMLRGAIREARLERENRHLVAELKELVQELQAREQELEQELKIRTQELKDVMNQVLALQPSS